jgi:hypothetical protein
MAGAAALIGRGLSLPDSSGDNTWLCLTSSFREVNARLDQALFYAFNNPAERRGKIKGHLAVSFVIWCF